MQNKNKIRKSALAPTILIAGGAGFVGSHLAEILLKREARVIILDNFSTGKDIYINHLLQNPKFALFDVDINQGIPEDIESVDYIFHLAGLEEYLYSKEEVTLDSLLTNAVGTKTLLDLAQKSDAKLLLASTTDIYGGSMSQLSLDNYYGKTEYEEKKYGLAEAKRYAEALLWEYYKKHNTDVRIVRLPEVYGPRMSLSSTGILGKFLKDLIDNRNLTIEGDGTQKEYYLYVDDAVSGMVKALLNEKTEGKIFTLVPEDSSTILEIAYLVKSLADRQIDIGFVETERIARKLLVPDTYNLGILDWKPRTVFKDGVGQTLSWFGYKTNEHTFKNSQMIEDKKSEGGTLTTLQGSTEPVVPTPVETETPVQPEASVPPEQQYDTREIEPAKKIRKPRRVRVKKEPKEKTRKYRLRLPKPKKLDLSFSNMSFSSKLSMFLVVLFSFLTVFMFMPIFQVYTSSKKAMTELQQVPEYISQFDADRAAISADQARSELVKANKYLSSLSWLFKLTGKKDTFESTSKFISSVTYFSNVAYDVSKSAAPYTLIWETMKPTSDKSFDPAILDETKLHISNAKNNLELAIADYQEVDPEKIPNYVKDGADVYKGLLDKTRDGLDLAHAVTSDLPGLLGFDESKKYLILFQNNNEIRPTGGFIGSYAFLYLNEGKIEELNIDDIYNPDGQLDVRNIKVTPPKPIGDFLIEDRLYIRNANWDPDLPRSATAIKDLFFRINGEDIDGVITVDLHMVGQLLNVTGPLYIANYDEEIGSDNLYERTQHHSSFNYEEGSEQKRQFLTVLGSKLLESLFALEREKTPDLLEVLGASLEQRHLQIHLFSSPLNASLMDRKWSGNLVRTEGDYLNVVNANLGGTKANYYVDNEMEYVITSKTRDGLLRAELTLNYTHSGEDESWPGGPYTDYVRVLTQKGSKLTGAIITYDQTLEEDIFESVTISQVEPYTSFETSFVLKPSSEIKLQFYYDLPANLSIVNENVSYDLVWQKQPGTSGDDYYYSFSVPFGMEYMGGEGNIEYSDGKVGSTGVLNEDFEVSIELQ
ncbi:NAD-dependent epimerase/dehydratase family protein [Patescibacteria group bacterium]